MVKQVTAKFSQVELTGANWILSFDNHVFFFHISYIRHQLRYGCLVYIWGRLQVWPLRRSMEGYRRIREWLSSGRSYLAVIWGIRDCPSFVLVYFLHTLYCEENSTCSICASWGGSASVVWLSLLAWLVLSLLHYCSSGWFQFPVTCCCFSPLIHQVWSASLLVGIQ